MMQPQEQDPAMQAQMQQIMQQPGVMEAIQGMDPAQREQYMQGLFADYQGQDAINTDEAAMAAELRNKSGAEGRQAGRVYVAANPLEHLASGLERNQARKDLGAAQDRRRDMSAQKAAATQQTGQIMAGSAAQNAGGQSEEARIAAMLRQGQNPRGYI